MKKRVFTVALVICLVAIVGFGSLAYFQSSKNLTNKFYVAGTGPNGPSSIDPDDLFSIKLDEQVINSQDRTENGNTYEGILPGDTLDKDPTVTNTGKYNAWVRMKVTVTDYSAWVAACGKHGITDLGVLFEGFDDTKWERGIYDEKHNTTADEFTFVYYYLAELAPEESATLFTAVKIPSTFDVEDMASLATFEFKITAEAIQAANTGANAKAAFRDLWVEATP